MNLIEKFKDYIKQNNLFQKKDKLLLAVSGGIDSVVLCELCKQAGYDFVIAHCNFKLRGADSERDEAFVKELAQKYGVEFFVKQFDTTTIAQKLKKGIEETARDLRYEWFKELTTDDRRRTTDDGLQTVGNGKGKFEINRGNSGQWSVVRGPILTAHHANDNIETVMMNFFRGSGIKGLRGILPKQNNIIRPLLFARKAAIKDFALQNNLHFVEDYTNAENDYTRNYFRNELIPALQKVYPMVEENILQNISRLKGVEELYNEAIDLQKKKLIEHKGNEVHIPVLKLLKISSLSTVLYEIVKDFNFTAHQTDETISLLKSETGKYISSATHRIIKNRNWLIISPNKTTEAENILIEANDTTITYSLEKIELKKLSIINYQLTTNNLIASVDSKDIAFPLLLRKWKQGDYFYPLGMQKKKKLSRFLIDQKLSLTQKENVWVIEMNKKIIWVVGIRIDDRFKIKETTKDILELRLSSTE